MLFFSLSLLFYMYREGLTSLLMSYLSSEIASTLTFYKYFGPKIKVLAPEEV